MKMGKENNDLITIIEKLKKEGNGKGVQQALALTGETFSCVRMAMYEYHVYQDTFERKYEWSAGKLPFDKTLNETLKKEIFANKKDILEKNLLSKIMGDNIDEKALEEHVFYHYVIETRGQVHGVIILEREKAFSKVELQEVALIIYMVSEEYSTEKDTKELKVQNNFLQTLYSKMQTGLVQCVMEENAMRVIWANEAAFQIYGCTREWYEQVYGKSMERFIYVEDWPYVKQQLENMQVGEEIKEYEHRYISYFGQMRWLHVNALKLVNENQEEVIQLIFSDITHSKQLENDLEHEKERYRIAIDSSSDVIFEYDLLNDEYVSYGSFIDNSLPRSTPILTSSYKKKLLKGKICDSDMISRYVDFLSGDDMKPFELRERYKEGDCEGHIWVAIEGTPIYDNGMLIKIIGKKSNINEKKQKEKKELEVVQRDRLTKLYTRAVGEELIRQYLEEKSREEIGSFLLIDLDNFQVINDTYGYTFGDAILEEVAEVIKAATRQNDISVRYGGDEFLILMKNTEPGRTAVYGKRIHEKICGLYAGEDENIKVSCSVGMVSTEMTQEYETLFQYADGMLAYVKNHGKNDAVCYSLSSKAVIEMQGTAYVNANEGPVEEVPTGKDNEDIVAFAFSILEKTKDMRSAINLLLGKVGRMLRLNKISIIETDANFLSNIITYEWIAKKEYHDSICKYNLSQEELEQWKSCFDGEGLFVMTDEWREKFSDGVTLEGNAPRKRNQLYSAIYEEGEFKGAVVFEHSDPLDVWPRDVRTKLKEVSKIISTHITKANADIASKAKTEFLSRMSHEIRTPMNAIVGMTSIAQSVVGDEKKVSECLAKIDTSTQYLLSLINDILDMSRIESGSMSVCQEAFDLDKLVSEIVVLMSPQAENKDINLVVKRSYTDLHLIGDELRLNQVLINIIGNALKFTPERGSITIAVQQLMQEDDAATIRFSVEDTGIGINENNLERIFTAFEQAESNTARRFGGTGLGLAISSNLVKLMGGKLDVRSQEGVGSEFFFTLQFPLAQTEEKEADQTVESGEKKEIHFENCRLLVVEDNDLNAEIAQTVLDMVGIKTERAEDGKQAVDIFQKKESGYFDAILMDIRMPVMDGLEATKCIRTSGKEDSRKIPIIAMTANAFDEDMKKSIDCGMNGHLSKPIDINKLYKVLQETLHVNE